jgi:hypothetical protein
MCEEFLNLNTRFKGLNMFCFVILVVQTSNVDKWQIFLNNHLIISVMSAIPEQLLGTYPWGGVKRVLENSWGARFAVCSNAELLKKNMDYRLRSLK